MRGLAGETSGRLFGPPIWCKKSLCKQSDQISHGNYAFLYIHRITSSFHKESVVRDGMGERFLTVWLSIPKFLANLGQNWSHKKEKRPTKRIIKHNLSITISELKVCFAKYVLSKIFKYQFIHYNSDTLLLITSLMDENGGLWNMDDLHVVCMKCGMPTVNKIT